MRAEDRSEDRKPYLIIHAIVCISHLGRGNERCARPLQLCQAPAQLIVVLTKLQVRAQPQPVFPNGADLQHAHVLQVCYPAAAVRFWALSSQAAQHQQATCQDSQYAGTKVCSGLIWHVNAIKAAVGLPDALLAPSLLSDMVTCLTAPAVCRSSHAAPRHQMWRTHK